MGFSLDLPCLLLLELLSYFRKVDLRKRVVIVEDGQQFQDVRSIIRIGD